MAISLKDTIYATRGFRTIPLRHFNTTSSFYNHLTMIKKGDRIFLNSFANRSSNAKLTISELCIRNN